MTTEPTATEGQAPEPEPRSEAFAATADEQAEVDDDALDPRTRAALSKLRRENHSLRSRLHESEEQVGAAAARETQRQRADIEAIAAEHLVEGQDIWRAQPDMDAFIDEQFHEITRDRVVETAKQLASEKPHLARPNVSPPPSQQPIESLRPGASPEVKPKPTRGAGALRGR